MYGPRFSESDWKWVAAIFYTGLAALFVGSITAGCFLLYVLYLGIKTLLGF